jgi:hypothetical protein
MTAPMSMGVAAGDRVEPTPEDLAIFQRNLRRIMKWQIQQHPLAPGESRSFPIAVDMLAPFRNFCGDYLHYAPRRRA